MKQLALAALITLSGCQLFGLGNAVSSTVEMRATYQADETRVLLVLINRTDQAVGYNLCLSSIENQQTRQRYSDPLVDCQPSLSMLQSKEKEETTLFFGASDVPPGTYRAVTTIEIDGDAREIASASFVIL